MQLDESLFRELGLKPQQVCVMSQQEARTGVWLYACDSGRYWWSPQVYAIYGLRRSTPLDGGLFLRQVLEEDVELARSSFAAALAGKAYRFRHRICVGGKTRWLEQRGRLRTARSGARYLLGTVRDVTDVERRQLRLEHRRQDYAAITQYLGETSDTTNLTAIVTNVKRTIRKRMDVAVIAVFVRQSGEIRQVFPKHMDYRQAFLFQSPEDFVGYRAVITGRRQLLPVADYPTARGREALLELGGGSVVAMPIRHHRVVIGALSVVLRHPGDMNSHEREFCRTICGYLSNQLNNALLYHQLRQELDLRTRLESDRDVIFNESVDFICILGANGRFAQINPAFAARLGATQQALLGQSVFSYVHPEDRAGVWNVFQELPRLAVMRGLRNRFLFGDREVGYLESNLKYMEATGEVIVIARDLTSQRAMEARNSLLEESLAFARSKSEFFAGLSHEFKTPLNIILSSLDLIRLKSVREDAQRHEAERARFFGHAYRNCYKLQRLAGNLLDSIQLESGHAFLKLQRLRLAALLRSAVEQAALCGSQRGVAVTFHCAAREPVWLVCDEEAVERAVLNLLSNAIKNTGAGGSVRVSLALEAGGARIDVADNGVGIPPETLPHIFDKFVTTRSPDTGRREGSGIGLALVRLLVEHHGGTVTAESRVGEGSCFTLRLPDDLQPTGEPSRPDCDAMAQRARLELADVNWPELEA